MTRQVAVWQLVLLVGTIASISEAFVSPISKSCLVRPLSKVSFVTREAKKKKNYINSLVDKAAEDATSTERAARSERADPVATAVSVETDAPVQEAASVEQVDEVDIVESEEEAESNSFDIEQMRIAIQMAQSSDGAPPFPKPVAGAVIVSKSGKVLGRGRSDYKKDCVVAAIEDAGLECTPLTEWCVPWTSDSKLREEIKEATLYLTLEPTAERKGEVLPPITELIEVSGISRVVIGCPHPIPELTMEGSATLHSAGLQISMGVEQEDCELLISKYAIMANTKLQRMARSHVKQFGRPLGFLHCSVVDSDNIEAFARHGNAFGKDFGGKLLSFRDSGTYEIAPPPESIWATDVADTDESYESEVDDFFNMDFDEEEEAELMARNPMMPWYEQVDAVVTTLPNPGNGPNEDNSLQARLFGLTWLATSGKELPANVERILVMDATQLNDLPMFNDDPNLPTGTDVETLWGGEGRKPTRVLLRRGENAQAQAAAHAAAHAAQAAANAAKAAVEALESGDAAMAAESAIESQKAAATATEFIQKELSSMQALKRKLQDTGVIVDVLPHGGDPLDVMNFLGKRNGYQSVVWRAGCWGGRGVDAIIAGAFQWVSAHLAVDAVGGKFWQLMLAERAVQAACGPARKVKIFSDQEDISMEYCDDQQSDADCVLTVDGRPVRHVRLDCRVALLDADRPREFLLQNTEKMTKQIIGEEAPWFL